MKPRNLTNDVHTQLFLRALHHRNGRVGLLVNLQNLQSGFFNHILKLFRIPLLASKGHHEEVKVCIHR